MRSMVAFGKIEARETVELVFATRLTEEQCAEWEAELARREAAHFAKNVHGIEEYRKRLAREELPESMPPLKEGTEEEPCAKGTPGCSILHGRVGVSEMCLPY